MFGQLPLHLRILLFGRYGSGKSSFALKFAESISSVSWRGTTIYVCAEEGSESATMQQKLDEQNIESDNIVFVDTLEDMLEAVRELNARNVVIDSINRLHLNVAQVTELYDKIKGIFILVAHSTKTLDFKGESGFAHDADIVAMMDAGTLSFEKNRFHSIGKAYRMWEMKTDMENDDGNE
jgi:predicted ATP-dependent serine protease